MPIKHRNLYPIDWEQISDRVRFGRAGGRCEISDRPHKTWILQLDDGRWCVPVVDGNDGFPVWRDDRGRFVAHPDPVELQGVRTYRVLISCAHRNHIESDCRDRNLVAVCQRIHLLHDREDNARRRRITLLRRRALGDLFDGRYPVL